MCGGAAPKSRPCGSSNYYNMSTPPPVVPFLPYVVDPLPVPLGPGFMPIQPVIGSWSIGAIVGAVGAWYLWSGGFALLPLIAVIGGLQLGGYLWFWYVSTDGWMGLNVGNVLGPIAAWYLLVSSNLDFLAIAVILAGWIAGQRFDPNKSM
jgi:hypothetical protein